MKDTGKELDTKIRGAVAVVEGKTGLRRGQADYQKVYDRIAEKLEQEGYDGESDELHDDSGQCSQTDGSLAPVLIRLAWHSSGTFNKEDGTGGSNYATMRFKPEAEHGANNGLVSGRLSSSQSEALIVASHQLSGR